MARLSYYAFLITLLFFINAHAYPQNTVAQESPQQYDEWRAAWQHLQAAFRDVGNWFVRQYRTVQSWFAKSKQELVKKVEDMVNFLGTVRDNMNALAEGAGTQLQVALQNVNNYYNDVVQFQQKVRDDVTASFEALEDEWQRKVQNMYNGGLDKIINAAEAAKMNPVQREGDTGNSSATDTGNSSGNSSAF